MDKYICAILDIPYTEQNNNQYNKSNVNYDDETIKENNKIICNISNFDYIKYIMYAIIIILSIKLYNKKNKNNE